MSDIKCHADKVDKVCRYGKKEYSINRRQRMLFIICTLSALFTNHFQFLFPFALRTSPHFPHSHSPHLPNCPVRFLSIKSHIGNAYNVSKLKQQIGRRVGPRSDNILLEFPLTDVDGGPLSNKYELKQFHFHWGDTNSVGSEHVIDDKVFAAEVTLQFTMHVVSTSRLRLLEYTQCRVQGPTAPSLQGWDKGPRGPRGFMTPKKKLCKGKSRKTNSRDEGGSCSPS